MATDDSHNYHSSPAPEKQSRSGRGWVMVRSEKLDAASLVNAAGDALEVRRLAERTALRPSRVRSNAEVPFAERGAIGHSAR
jgi:hypothetical protein